MSTEWLLWLPNGCGHYTNPFWPAPPHKQSCVTRPHPSPCHTLYVPLSSVPQCEPISKQVLPRTVHSKLNHQFPIVRHHRLYNGNKGGGVSQNRGGHGQKGTHHCVPERPGLALSVRSESDVVIGQHCGPTELPERNLHTYTIIQYIVCTTTTLYTRLMLMQ